MHAMRGPSPAFGTGEGENRISACGVASGVSGVEVARKIKRGEDVIPVWRPERHT